MSNQPPKEGARWGDDPEPAPQPVPQEPEGYRELCDDYGEVNVQKALALQTRLRDEYPTIAMTKIEPMHFAAETLSLANFLMRNATADGRVHTMSNTFEVFDQQLGKNLAKYPDIVRFGDIPSWSLSYGDEREGTAFKRKLAQTQAQQNKEQQSVEFRENIVTILLFVSPFLVAIGAAIVGGPDLLVKAILTMFVFFGFFWMFGGFR